MPPSARCRRQPTHTPREQAANIIGAHNAGIRRPRKHPGCRSTHAGEGTACLQQALAIYQRIAAPAARRVQETLIQFRQDNLPRPRSGKPPDPNSHSKLP